MRILFEVTASAEMFYSEANMEQLKRAEQQVKEGKVVIKTMEELEAMEFE